MLRVLDENIARLSSGNVVFQGDGPSQLSLELTTLNPGATEIVIEAPPGIPLKPSRIPVRVLNWGFGLPANVSVGRNLMVPVSVSNVRAADVNAAVSSTGAAPLLIGTDRITLGQASIALTIPGRSSRTFFVEGPAQGSAGAVSVNASGFDTALCAVQVTDPIVTLSGYGALQAGAGPVNALVTLGIESSISSEQPLGASQSPITVKVRSSDPAVVRPGADSLQIGPGESARTLALQPGRSGTAILTLEAPPGFNPPSGTREYTITVR
jgi:hypothetical protein